MIGLDHQHSGKAVENAVAHIKLLATSNKLQFESNVQSAAYKAEHNLLIQGSDFNSLESPAKITLKRQTKQKTTDMDFMLLIKTDAAQTFRLPSLTSIRPKAGIYHATLTSIGFLSCISYMCIGSIVYATV